MPVVAFLSFRFSDTDGVSVVTKTWRSTFEALGYETYTVAGVEPADRVVHGLGIGADTAPDRDQLRDALGDADLVVVENLATIPLNLPASRMVGRVLAGRPAILHHHDPPWHRQDFAHVTELPLDDPSWRHVSITRTAASEMADRGIGSTVVRNAFPAAAGGDDMGRRAGVRAELEVGDADLLVAHPVRAIERKNIRAAIELSERLGAVYWLLGPAEDGYGPTLQTLLADARCPTRHRPWPDIDGLYAAADVIAYPSTWEGFGNPPIEASLRRRPSAVGCYPAATELRTMGFRFFDPTDDPRIAGFVAEPDEDLLDHNAALATEHFSMERLRVDLGALLADAGWLP